MIIDHISIFFFLAKYSLHFKIAFSIVHQNTSKIFWNAFSACKSVTPWELHWLSVAKDYLIHFFFTSGWIYTCIHITIFLYSPPLLMQGLWGGLRSSLQLMWGLWGGFWGGLRGERWGHWGRLWRAPNSNAPEQCLWQRISPTEISKYLDAITWSLWTSNRSKYLDAITWSLWTSNRSWKPLN